MHTFFEWLSQLDLIARLRLLETYFSFDPAQYNSLFDEELQKVIARTSDSAHRERLERLRDFDWMSYIAAAVRHAGYRDYREGQEAIHDVAVKLLTGKLFRGFDERTSGPMDLRFKRSLSNALKNATEKERNRKRYLPSIPIRPEFVPGGVTPDDLAARETPESDPQMIDRFREMVRQELGATAVEIFDARMQGLEMKSLPMGRYTTKKLIQGIKHLARQYAVAGGDPVFLRQVERLMAAEQATIQRRKAAMQQRVNAG